MRELNKKLGEEIGLEPRKLYRECGTCTRGDVECNGYCKTLTMNDFCVYYPDFSKPANFVKLLECKCENPKYKSLLEYLSSDTDLLATREDVLRYFLYKIENCECVILNSFKQALQNTDFEY